VEHIILLPEVEHPDHFTLLLLGALVQVVEGDLGILGKPWREHIFLRTKLVSTLSHDGVNHIKAWDFIFRLALLDEFFHTLDHMFVELDCPDGSLGDGSHLGFGDGRLRLVQGGHLLVEGLYSLHDS